MIWIIQRIAIFQVTTAYCYKIMHTFNKVEDKQINFNVRECKKFINMVSDSTLQLTFKKLLLIQCLYSIVSKMNIHYYLKMLFKIIPSPSAHFHGAGFPLITSTKTTQVTKCRSRHEHVATFY